MLPIYNDTYGPQIPESSANHIFDSIVRIEKATGFFLKIKIRDRELKCLMTNYHVIPQEYVTSKKTVFLYYGKKEKEIKKRIELNSNERFIRCFREPKDVTIIEIKNYDYIPDYKFLEPDLDYKTGYYRYLYKKYYLAGYPSVDFSHQDERHISSGLITKIGENYFEFEHSLDRRFGSSGSPICLLSNEKVVGIHKANTYKPGYGNYSFNIATFIGIIIDELDDEYYLLPKIKSDKSDLNQISLSNKLTHCKTQNLFNFSQSSKNFSINDFSYSETKSSLNMNLLDFNINLGFEKKKITNKNKPSLTLTNDEFHIKINKQKKENNKRSKTPLNYQFSRYDNKNSSTKKESDDNDIDLFYSLKKTSIRLMNKSCEPKLKYQKKKKEKKTNNNITNINTIDYQLNNNKSKEIYNYSKISNYTKKSNYYEVTYKKETFKAKWENKENLNSGLHTSKSYDNITFSKNNNKTSLNISTIQSNNNQFYRNNDYSYSNYNNYRNYSNYRPYFYVQPIIYAIPYQPVYASFRPYPPYPPYI